MNQHRHSKGPFAILTLSHYWKTAGKCVNALELPRGSAPVGHIKETLCNALQTTHIAQVHQHVLKIRLHCILPTALQQQRPQPLHPVDTLSPF